MMLNYGAHFVPRPLPPSAGADLCSPGYSLALWLGWDDVLCSPYGFADLAELLDGLETEHYHWEMGYAPRPKGGTFGIYLLGSPT